MNSRAASQPDGAGDGGSARLEAVRRIGERRLLERDRRGSSRRPPGTGGIASSCSSRPYSTPIPDGPYTLCPGERVEVAAQVLDVDAAVGGALRAVHEDGDAALVRHVARSRRIGIPRAERVRDVRDRDDLRPGTRGALSRRRAGAPRRRRSGPRAAVAPFSSQTICHGTMFEWCSIVGEDHLVARADVRGRRKLEATRLIASVAPRTKTISRAVRGVHETADRSRALPRTPRSPVPPARARRDGCSRTRSRRSATCVSMTDWGFWVLAALSR